MSFVFVRLMIKPVIFRQVSLKRDNRVSPVADAAIQISLLNIRIYKKRIQAREIDIAYVAL